MSHTTIAKLNDHDWKADHYISLGCLSCQALERFLLHNAITKIIIRLNNDADSIYSDGSLAPNWGQEAGTSS